MKELNLNYVHTEDIGYGRMGVKLAAALEAKGITVWDDMPTPAGVDEGAVETDTGRAKGLAETVVWCSVPSHALGWWSTQRPAIFSMWEATRLPESFRDTLHLFDTVLVPSDHNVELFGAYHRNVKRVLLGIDPAEWHYVERKAPGRFFDFLIGGSGPRKGTDVAHRAFFAAFPDARTDGPIPRLVMKNPKSEPFDLANGRVEMIGGKISAEAERALYASAHCYLQPSRGEGFGLQPLQAIAQGLPTILTDAHGHEAFAYLGYGLDSKLEVADYFSFGDAGEWWEPDFDQLVDTMRYVYDNYDECEVRARDAAGVVAREFTWANSADQFLEALGELNPFTPTDEWVTPTPLKYVARTTRTMNVDIAGRFYTFKAGQDYRVTADVKRVLGDGGHLDPACTVDVELTPEEHVADGMLEDPPHYCPHCGQRDNSGKTFADDIFDELEAAVR